MKKVLSIVLAMMMVLALAVPAFAAKGTVLGTLDNVSTELEVLRIGTTLNTGDKVVLHFTGTTTGAFRYWLSAGTWTACSEQVTVTDTEFDILVEMEVTADGANEVQFKGPSYGVSLDGLTITYCEVFIGTMDEYNAAEDAPETPVDEAPADEPVDAPVDAPVEDAPVEDAPVETEPAETGLLFAVIPAIIAMAAVVVSKRR